MDETYEIRNGQPVHYVFAGSLRIAEIRDGQVRYHHKDHLGSAAVVSDAAGNLLESMVHEAYGQPRRTCETLSGTMAYTCTDREWDAETGLYNYDARLNDPVLGRFLTADSINEIALNLISLIIAAVDSWILTFQSSFGIIAFNKSKSPHSITQGYLKKRNRTHHLGRRPCRWGEVVEKDTLRARKLQQSGIENRDACRR